MGWPEKFHPLPDILSDSLGYHMLVNSIGCIEMFVSLKISLWLELGYSQKYWELLAHCSKDVLQSLKKDNSSVDRKEMEEEIVRMNGLKYRQDLRAVVKV